MRSISLLFVAALFTLLTAGCQTTDSVANNATNNVTKNVTDATNATQQASAQVDGAVAEAQTQAKNQVESSKAEAIAAAKAAAQVGLGNGEANWIIVDGVTRKGDTLTFSEVHIDGNGWLVLHPFANGKPVGDRYVGSTYIASGDNRGVEIQLDSEPATGDAFIVMLHRDVNENQEFDFVFVDEINVLDKAVFEGRTMIAHRISVP